MSRKIKICTQYTSKKRHFSYTARINGMDDSVQRIRNGDSANETQVPAFAGISHEDTTSAL